MKRGRYYIGVGVGALIFDARGQVLLAKRGEGAQSQQGLWECPGGSVEFGEKHREALIREMSEELGVEIEITGLLNIADDIFEDGGQRCHWLSPNYICVITKGTPTVPEAERNKVGDMRWFSLQELPNENELTSVTRGMLAAYHAHL